MRICSSSPPLSTERAQSSRDFGIKFEFGVSGKISEGLSSIKCKVLMPWELELKQEGDPLRVSVHVKLWCLAHGIGGPIFVTVLSLI